MDAEPIILTISGQLAKPFYDWHRNFLAQGARADETFLIIECLSGDKKPTVLYSLQFGGVGRAS